MDAVLREFALRQGDNALILGHRLSEWCGHAPALEEDIAVANCALDLIGQTQMWLGLAADVQGDTTADALAYHRDAQDFRNLLLVEQPNGHFGTTMMRQFLFDAFQIDHLEALMQSQDRRVADIAAKSHKEARYHYERSRTTVIALGDGTPESHAKMQAALDDLWPFVGEMFVSDTHDAELAERQIAPLPSHMKAAWMDKVHEVMALATLQVPQSDYGHLGGRNGTRHTEHLSHLLAVMQVLPRSHPDAVW